MTRPWRQIIPINFLNQIIILLLFENSNTILSVPIPNEINSQYYAGFPGFPISILYKENRTITTIAYNSESKTGKI